MFDDRSRVILAVSPQKDGLTVPAENDVRSAALEKAEAVAVTAWNDAASATELMAARADTRRRGQSHRDAGPRASRLSASATASRRG